MARFLKIKRDEIGRSPDSLLFTGTAKMQEVVIRGMEFGIGQVDEFVFEKMACFEKFVRPENKLWLNIDGLHDEALMKKISEEMKISPLIFSDIMDTHQRAKFSDFDQSVLISLKIIDFDEKLLKVRSDQLSLIVQKNLVVSFQEKRGIYFDPLRERIRLKKNRLLTSGIDYLVFNLLDIVIDHYLLSIAQIGERIEVLADKILEQQSDKNLLNEIYHYKHELNFLGKNILPVKELLLKLRQSQNPLFEKKNELFFERLSGNIQMSLETLDSYKNLLNDHLTIYHTNVSHRLNEIMKFLTIFSVIFIPLTFIAGVYGTNFDYIPELSYRYSYFIMWFIMIFVAIVMILYFRKKKWFS